MSVATAPNVPSILVVEDEMFVAMLVEDILSNSGYRVTKAARVDKALEMVDHGDPFDAALLDINLNGVEVFPVAAKLREMGVPFVFASGYGREGLPPDFSDSPVLQKPYLPDALRDAVAALLGRTNGVTHAA